MSNYRGQVGKNLVLKGYALIPRGGKRDNSYQETSVYKSVCDENITSSPGCKLPV